MNISAQSFWATRFLKLTHVLLHSPVNGSSDVRRKARFHMLEVKSQPRLPFALVELGARRLQTQQPIPYAAGRAGSIQNNHSDREKASPFRPFLQATLSQEETWILHPYLSRVQDSHLSFPQATLSFLNNFLGLLGPETQLRFCCWLTDSLLEGSCGTRTARMLYTKSPLHCSLLTQPGCQY